MWKPKQSALLEPHTASDGLETAASASANSLPRPSAMPSATGEAVIGKELTITGEITGDSPMFIDGSVEGNIDLPGARVTIGPHGRVSTGSSDSTSLCITAQEIIILGKVMGTVCGTDRVEIKAQGALTGDIRTARISIADGAFFHGGIEILKEASPSPE